MRIILLDDEKSALDELQYYLNQYAGIEIAGVFTDPVKVLEDIGNIKFDAAFLDIDMPVVNGLNVAGEILGRNSQVGIVFVTAFNDYAVRAFEVNAIDYILKPITKDRLDIAVEKLMKAAEKESGFRKNVIEKLNRIDKYIKQDLERIAAYDDDDDEITLLKMSDILYFEALLGNTVIAAGDSQFKSKDTLDTLQAKYGRYGFYRCHRSYLVNMRHINKISHLFNNSYIVRLEGSEFRIPVSRKNNKELKRLLGIE